MCISTHIAFAPMQKYTGWFLLPFIRAHIALKYNTVAKHVATSTFPELNPTTAYECTLSLLLCCECTKKKSTLSSTHEFNEIVLIESHLEFESMQQFR